MAKSKNVTPAAAPVVDPKDDGAVPPEFHNAVSNLKSAIRKLEDGNLHSHRAIGEEIVKIMNDPKCGKPKFKKIVEHFSTGRDTLRPARDVATRFTEDEFDELTKLSGKDGHRLTWSHVTALCVIKDKDELKKTAKKIVEEGLTIPQTKKFIKAANGGATSGGGRPHKKAASFTDLCDTIIDRISGLSNYIDATFADADEITKMFDAQDEAGKMPKDIVDVIDNISELVGQASMKMTMGSAVLDRLKTRATKPVDDDDDEDAPDEELVELEEEEEDEEE